MMMEEYRGLSLNEIATLKQSSSAGATTQPGNVIDKFSAAFNEAQKAEKGILKEEEFTKFVENLSADFSAKEASNLFLKYSSAGIMDENAFINLMIDEYATLNESSTSVTPNKLNSQTIQRLAENAMNEYSTSGTAVLNQEQFAKMAQSVGLEYSAEEINTIFEEYATEGQNLNKVGLMELL
jgi:Ca2+-binding EF-hand superfamily protein